MTEAVTGPQTASSVRLGLKENWPQFALLVLINAFVGGMVGLERTVVPLVGTEEFGIGSELVVFSFIITWLLPLMPMSASRMKVGCAPACRRYFTVQWSYGA